MWSRIILNVSIFLALIIELYIFQRLLQTSNNMHQIHRVFSKNYHYYFIVLVQVLSMLQVFIKMAETIMVLIGINVEVTGSHGSTSHATTTDRDITPIEYQNDRYMWILCVSCIFSETVLLLRSVLCMLTIRAAKLAAKQQ